MTRKLIYIVGIVALLVLVTFVAQPATHSGSGPQGSAGGHLAKLRDAYGLSQTSLGEIDPASESLKLATLGLRGVAASFLWNKASEYKKKENWEGASATAEQIIKLQPNFYTVWDFQAHNLSYNISAEFDDYRDRYWWVMRGINYLIEGTHYNDKEPRLTDRIGWYVSNKIGKADETVQFRRLFKNDTDFIRNKDREPEERDNWLVGYSYFKDAQRMIDNGAELRGMGASLFYSEAAMALINYATVLEKEGTFGSKAKKAWREASDEWNRFGEREIPTSFGLRVRLSELEMQVKKSNEYDKQIDELAPGVRDAIKEERKKDLSEEEQKALAIEPKDRTGAQNDIALAAENKLIVLNEPVIARITDSVNRERAHWRAGESARALNVARVIASPRSVVNWDYWTARCQMEPLDDTLAARESLYLADKAYKKTNFEEARRLYEDGFKRWRPVLDQFPLIREDNISADELAEYIDRYEMLISNEYSAEYPQIFDGHFVLQDVKQRADETNPDRIARKQKRAEAAKPAQTPKSQGDPPNQPGAKPDEKKDEKPAGDKSPD